ncbi:MAG: transposase [Syntrophorhabdales bacterium]
MIGATRTTPRLISRLLNATRDGFEKFKTLTLDLDSHVITIFGKQPRANKGCNPKKRGQKSHHPLLCFIGETRDYLGGILRPGNSTDANQARSFLTLMLRKLPFGMVTRSRADSGFFHMDFISWLIVCAGVEPARRFATVFMKTCT